MGGDGTTSSLDLHNFLQLKRHGNPRLTPLVRGSVYNYATSGKSLYPVIVCCQIVQASSGSGRGNSCSPSTLAFKTFFKQHHFCWTLARPALVVAQTVSDLWKASFRHFRIVYCVANLRQAFLLAASWWRLFGTSGQLFLVCPCKLQVPYCITRMAVSMRHLL